MKHFYTAGICAVLALSTAACDKLGIGHHEQGPTEAPTAKQLQKIDYMSADNSGPGGRKVYTRFEQARTCGDFELAMRWNRPPGVAGGPFHQKMVYLDATLPADLAKNTEVFIHGTIDEGEILPSGSARWYIRMKDGTLVEAIEGSGYMEKQAQAAQENTKQTALVSPEKPHRTICAHGIYQGVTGKDPKKDAPIPLVAVLFAMDRKK